MFKVFHIHKLLSPCSGIACEPGTYCPEGSSFVQSCEAGQYCPQSSETFDCPAGKISILGLCRSKIIDSICTSTALLVSQNDAIATNRLAFNYANARPSTQNYAD